MPAQLSMLAPAADPGRTLRRELDTPGAFGYRLAVLGWIGRLRPSRPRAAAVCAIILCIAATWFYAYVLNGAYPIRTWLFWPLASLFGWVGLFNVACFSCGQLVLRRVIRVRDLPVLDTALFSMVTGVVTFAIAMYAAGALALYNSAFAVALPLAMIALGAHDGSRLARDVLAELARPASRDLLGIAISAAGVLCLGAMYLQHMTPDSLNYDAAWCHLTVAQDYARAGRLIAFPTDFAKNVPHLSAMIHTWGWLLPGMTDPLRWMLVLHNELGLFAWTLVGVAAGVRYLVGDQDLRGAWVGFFLFPIIFVYDHNLGGATDHIAGFFAIPIMLAALRLRRTFSLPDAALFGVTCGGAFLTKYQAMYVAIPSFLLIGLRALRLLAARRMPRLAPADTAPIQRVRDVVWPIALAGLLTVAVLCPHMLCNTVFYHSPFYPFLHKVFPGTPNAPGHVFYFENYAVDPGFWIHGRLRDKALNAARLLFTFSFQPHYSFTHGVPAFGSLFTLLMPAALLVPRRAEILPATLIAACAVFIWGFTYFIDRNLQAVMPVLACTTCALIVELWRARGGVRLALIPLLALQIVWGADAMFYSARDRIRSSLDLISSGFDGTAATRFDRFRSVFVAINNALPQNARLLLHTSHLSLGINRDVLLDWAPYQALITYEHIHTPRELWDYYRSLGITHVMYEQPMVSFAPSKQEEVVWNGLIVRSTTSLGQFGPYRVAKLSDEPPPVEASYRVASFGVYGYRDGIYPIEAMRTIEYVAPANLAHFRGPEVAMPTDPEARAASIEDVDAVFEGPGVKLGEAETHALSQHFKAVLKVNGRYTLHLRKERVLHGR